VPHESIRIAIVGTGNIARIHMASLAKAGALGKAGAGAAPKPAGTPPKAEVVAAVDIDEARLAKFGHKYEISETFQDLGELLRKARPDLVHICTPPGLHHDQALACLRAGVTVLVEKPPAISLREFDELAAAEDAARKDAANKAAANKTAAGEGGPWLATVFQHRFGAGQRRLKTLAASGMLGRPLLAVCHTTWFRDQAYFDVPWRGRWDTEGGGPTMGHGIHQMDMMLDVLGDWASVSATAGTLGRRTQTEDVSLAHVTFSNGAAASVVNSLISPREESHLRYDFENATVELTHLYGYGDGNWRVTPLPEHADAVLGAWQAETVDDERESRSGHHAQFGEILSALRTGRRPPVGTTDSRRTLSLIAAIYASAFQGGCRITPADLAPGTPFYEAMNGGRSAW
jgi:predicted dehydrogenase